MRRLVGAALLPLVVFTVAYPAAASSSPPDGTTARILFDEPVTRGSGTDYDVFLMSVDGAERENLTDRAKNQQNPAWAPDGRAFSMMSGGEIHVTNPSATKLRRVVEATSPSPGIWWYPDQASWSSDGQRLVYTMFEDDESSLDPEPANAWSGIGLARSDGSRQTVLIPPTKGMTHYDPSFSPDGARIVFSRYTQRSDDTVTVDIFSMRSDGSDLVTSRRSLSRATIVLGGPRTAGSCSSATAPVSPRRAPRST